MSRRRVILVFALALALPGAASAWQVVTPTLPAGEAAVPPPAASDQGQKPDPCNPDPKVIQVTKVWSVPPYDDETDVPASPPSNAAKGEHDLPLVKLSKTIAVKVDGLQTLLDQERCLDKAGPRNIILYLDRRPLPDVVAAPPNDPSKGILMFPLERTEKSREVWTHLLGEPTLDDRVVEVSVGIDDRFAVGSVAKVDLRVIPYLAFSFWVLIFGILAVGFVILARKSDVLRDPVKPPYGARPPYSLARSQAAWWFFLILASYLLIGMVTGDFLTSPTGTVLVLLGISAGTAAGSAFLDFSKTDRAGQAQDIGRAQVLWGEIEKLSQEVAALESTVRQNGDPAKAQELADKAELLEEKRSMYRKLTNQSEGPLLDLLSDSSGVNFHRFQALAWTVVLGIIFGFYVYRDLAMPQFDETLLGLMGISSGTYLSLKMSEKPSPDPVPPTPASPPEPGPPPG